MLVACLGVQAVTIGFVSNVSSNSTDWRNDVLARGCQISTLDFSSHPNGALVSTHYQAQYGVTLSASNGFNSVVYSTGSSSGTTSTTPKSTGEGLHSTATSMLVDNDASSSLTVSFDRAIFGIGFYLVDLYNPSNIHPYKLEAFTGVNGTGTSLGSVNAAGYNFQLNYIYFMGLVSTAGDIRSVVISDIVSGTGDGVFIDDIVFASVPELSTWCLLLVASALVFRFHRNWR